MIPDIVETRTLKMELWLDIKTEFPEKAILYGLPLQEALIAYPENVRFEDGIIYIKEELK